MKLTMTIVVATVWWMASLACQSRSAPNQQLFTNAAGSPISIPDGPGNVLIGDLNNDQKPDLVVACARNRTIMVLPGKARSLKDD